MADNVVLNPGAGGATAASDDIGGIQHQRVKVEYGADGTAQDVHPGAPLPVTEGLLAPKVSAASAAAVAAGGSADLDSAQVAAGATAKLAAVLVASSVPLKVELKTMLNGVESAVLAVWFVAGYRPSPLVLPKGFITQAQDAGAGLDGFRVTVTNMDTSRPADLYASFFTDEVT